ncbi:TetR/AcrR family transcriptional regulator [Gordonia aquimaris]|uniref:TetR/AcrR family transcriptional regulator n=1 Tax=Gordonia aquimaris TaxID=2984863 RepID=A0A9X3I6J9_9ACTN|nr:TetR/AcrR family transcriptional regulator [Gordonia aquimaris]MCX2966135.1 TetR/AcrR family transcriptional regulator [Gordonia aquimaris]
MPPPATQDKRATRRQQIVDAAWEVANESGLGAVTLHEVARRVGMRQPSLYSYVSSKLDLFDVMFAEAYEHLLARIDSLPATGSAREQLLRLSQTIVDYVVENPPRQQLLFQRTIPGFEPSEASYRRAELLVRRTQSLLVAAGATDPAQLDAYTAVIAGIGAQQIANDPGGTRWTRHVETMVGLVVDHFPRERATP